MSFGFIKKNVSMSRYTQAQISVTQLIGFLHLHGAQEGICLALFLSDNFCR